MAFLQPPPLPTLATVVLAPPLPLFSTLSLSLSLLLTSHSLPHPCHSTAALLLYPFPPLMSTSAASLLHRQFSSTSSTLRNFNFVFFCFWVFNSIYRVWVLWNLLYPLVSFFFFFLIVEISYKYITRKSLI